MYICLLKNGKWCTIIEKIFKRLVINFSFSLSELYFLFIQFLEGFALLRLFPLIYAVTYDSNDDNSKHVRPVFIQFEFCTRDSHKFFFQD